ncbi:MAG: hypothetical protein KDE27_20925 [Planctomycetes bacterium]|nr:hypothetical protein [Planctomycetota bacterium]
MTTPKTPRALGLASAGLLALLALALASAERDPPPAAPPDPTGGTCPPALAAPSFAGATDRAVDNAVAPVSPPPQPDRSSLAITEPRRRLRLYGTTAGLRLLEDAVRGAAADHLAVELVRGDRPAALCTADFDVAVVLTPGGERFAPNGLQWRFLGDFVPVLLPARSAAGAPRTLVARRLLPLVEHCMPELRDWRGVDVEVARDLRAVETDWLAHPELGALVPLAALQSTTLAGSVPLAIAGTVPTDGAFRAGQYPFGTQVHVVFARADARVRTLLEHLATGAGRAALRRLLI